MVTEPANQVIKKLIQKETIQMPSMDMGMIIGVPLT